MNLRKSNRNFSSQKVNEQQTGGLRSSMSSPSHSVHRGRTGQAWEAIEQGQIASGNQQAIRSKSDLQAIGLRSNWISEVSWTGSVNQIGSQSKLFFMVRTSAILVRKSPFEKKIQDAWTTALWLVSQLVWTIFSEYYSQIGEASRWKILAVEHRGKAHKAHKLWLLWHALKERLRRRVWRVAVNRMNRVNTDEQASEMNPNQMNHSLRTIRWVSSTKQILNLKLATALIVPRDGLLMSIS